MDKIYNKMDTVNTIKKIDKMKILGYFYIIQLVFKILYNSKTYYINGKNIIWSFIKGTSYVKNKIYEKKK